MPEAECQWLRHKMYGIFLKTERTLKPLNNTVHCNTVLESNIYESDREMT